MEIWTRGSNMEGSEDRTEIKNGREDEMKDGWGQMEATDRGQEESRGKREEKVEGETQEVS